MPPENYNHKTLWVVQNMLKKNQLTTRCQGNLMDQCLWFSLPASAALITGIGKAVPVRSTRNTSGKNCRWILLSETNFTAKSLSHICNSHVCDGWFAFSLDKVGSVREGHGLVRIPFSLNTKAQSPPAAAPVLGWQLPEPFAPWTLLCPWRVQDRASALFKKCFQQPIQSCLTWPCILSTLPANSLPIWTRSQ